MTRFLLDVGVGKKVQNLLESRGFDVVSMLDIDRSATDESILNIAAAQNRMVVTMDKDFGELVFRSGQSHSGVLLLRLEDANGDEKAAIMELILEKHQTDLTRNFCVFQNNRLRIRRAF